MRITKNEQEIRKNRTIHVAYDLFCECGIDNVSIEQIAIKSEISRISIFRYFKSKADLVQCTQIILWQEITNSILKECTSDLLEIENGLDEVSVMLYSLKQLYEKYSHYLLFSCDYKLFLVRNHIVLSKEQHNIIMEPIYSTFENALERGQKDGSINTNYTSKRLFLLLWGLIRGYLEQISVYDEMYAGENPWKCQFDLTIKLMIDALKANN